MLAQQLKETFQKTVTFWICLYRFNKNKKNFRVSSCFYGLKTSDKEIHKIPATGILKWYFVYSFRRGTKTPPGYATVFVYWNIFRKIANDCHTLRGILVLCPRLTGIAQDSAGLPRITKDCARMNRIGPDCLSLHGISQNIFSNYPGLHFALNYARLIKISENCFKLRGIT